MRIPPAVSYTLRRLALFLATLALAVPLFNGAPFVVPLIAATVASSLLSYFLLARQREAMARSLSNLGARIDAGAAREDAILDAAEQGETPLADQDRRRTGPKESRS